jgi:hypothetical protein
MAFALVLSACGVAGSKAPAEASGAAYGQAKMKRDRSGDVVSMRSQITTMDAADVDIEEESMPAPASAPPGEAAHPAGAGYMFAQGAPAPAPPRTTPPPISTAPVVAPGERGVREPLLIYTATLHLAVFETKKAMSEVEKLTKKLGGYLVQRDDSLIVVRVPADKFETALGGVAGLGDELHRSVKVDDITEAFNDLEIRLKNFEAVRRRLEELLARAVNVEEALSVEQQLERVAGEIESIKGRLKRFRELVAFSTIWVQFRPRVAEQVDSEFELPFPWLRELGLGRLLSL